MKPKQLLLFVLFLSLLLSIKIQNIFAQSPQIFKYQAIIRNNSGEVLANQNIALQISILQGSETGTPVYTETWTETTNQFGLINLNIGEGTSNDDFSLINWGNGSYWLKVAFDENGGTDYSDMGTSQLLSVPYALYAGESANGSSQWFVNGSDIYYSSGNVGIGTNTPISLLDVNGAITASGGNSNEWNTAYGWGNHADAGYLTSYTETDPVFSASPSNGITNTNITNWNTAYGWGNHADAGYLTSDLWSQNGNDIYYNSGNVGIGTNVPTKKLVIKAENDTDTLLEIQDKDGNPLMVITPSLTKFNIYQSAKGVAGGFAVGRYTGAKDIQDTSFLLVTPDSTRIYTGGTGKGVAGGFAVGRYTGAKSNPIAKYFYTDADSTRIFINESAKGVAGGFAVGRYTGAKGDIKDYFNIKASGTPQIINPSDARIFWYPLKEAFMSGRVLVESIDSVGQNSWASGYESKSKGDYSQALGYKARAFGDNSTAIGNYANAEGSESYAFGNHAYTKDEGSYAIGSGAKALGKFSFALGSVGLDFAGNTTSPTIANGDYAYAFGMGSVANDQGAFAFGTQDTASGKYSLATGYKTAAEGFASTAMGCGTKTSKDVSTAMGYFTIASDDYSTAMGEFTIANKEASTAMGAFTVASGISSTAMGESTTASGSGSVAMGYYTTASGLCSVAMGWGSSANGKYSAAMGYYTTARSYNSLVLGRYNIIAGDSVSWVDSDPLFVIGNGSSAADRHNAVTILKNGNVGIETTVPAQKLDVNGNIRLSGGDRIIETSSGYLDLRPHDGSYGLILRDFTGSSTVWSGFKTVDASTDYLHIAMNSTSTSEGLIISDNGNVGIGTTVPSQKLDVNGNIKLSYNLYGAYGTMITSRDEWLRLNDGATHTSGVYTQSHFRADGEIRQGIYDYGSYEIQTSGQIYTNDYLIARGGVHIGGTSDPTDNLIVDQGEIRQGIYDYGVYKIQTSGQIYANDYLIAMGGVHVGGTSDPGTDNLIVDNRVGIGTTAPSFPLHVESYVNSTYSYGYLNSGGSTGTGSGTVAVSIYAQRRVRAEEFNADSDERIKQKLGKSNSAKDLELLKKINITDYKYIDTISKGNKINKKVIAQELQQVYPRAVSVTTGFIPSVYAKAKSLKYDANNKTLLIETSKPHQFKSGDKIKLIYKDGVLKPKVTEVISDNVFAIKSDKNYNEIFVFGKKVDDFLTVDYEAISMLNVSAVQELIKRIEEQQKEINQLKEQNKEINYLEKQILELKDLIQNK